MLKLDFTIVSTDDRSRFVNDFFNANPSYVPTAHELETVTNYILYGKDPIDKHGQPTEDTTKYTNMSARHEIEIPTKHSSWKRQEPLSLDEAIESPTFNEFEISRDPILTKVTRPSIDRALEADIPTMQELWGIIDYYAEKLKDPLLSASQKYKLRHMLIELRREQFTLKDIFKPSYQRPSAANRSIYIAREGEDEIDWEAPDSNYGCAPMGLYRKGDARFEAPLTLCNEKDNWGYNLSAHVIIDFTNPDHVESIISHYNELMTYAIDHIFSAQKFILDTFNYYLSNTKINEIQQKIIEYKMMHMLNKDIAEKVNLEFNKKYNKNYISTIYRKSCGRISDVAMRKYTYYWKRIDPSAFKRCTCCNQLKLRDAEEFMRKSRNSDGFSTKCKECEHSGR